MVFTSCSINLIDHENYEPYTIFKMMKKLLLSNNNIKKHITEMIV